MKEVFGSGRTVEEAIQSALREIGRTLDQVDVEVLDEGTKGVFGLGARLARVRLIPIELVGVERPPAPVPDSETASRVEGLARELLAQMGFRVEISAQPVGTVVEVQFTGEDLAPLIGRHGQAIDACETILALMVARATGQRYQIALDIGGYRERRRQQVTDIAERAARRVLRDGRPVHLPAMDARERRIVHSSLTEEGRVTTRSEGEGETRHVVVEPSSLAKSRSPQSGRRPSRPGMGGKRESAAGLPVDDD
jgi:spoIIIJ-associated protein